MAKTNYKVCWWLIQAIDGEFGAGSYFGGRGYSLNELHKLKTHNNLDVLDGEAKEKFRQDFMRWRTIIYKDFGLAILQKSDPGVIIGHGGGGHYYFLANPEILDEEGRTLREHIEHLAEMENNDSDPLSLTQISKKFTETPSSMGFISSNRSLSYGFLSQAGTKPRKILGEENLDIIQFAMQFGEIITIKYGKVKAGVAIDAPYSFEPYQLKEIEGRWYVIGNCYPIGHKEQAELAIYDLERLQLADNENPDIQYVPIEGFDICEQIVIDYACKRRLGKILNLTLFSHNDEFSTYLSQHPLSAIQEEIAEGRFKIYARMTVDLIIQFGAYGDEFSFRINPYQRLELEDRDIFNHLLNFYRKTNERTRD